MSVPEDGYPLDLRDELFGLFASCLGSAEPVVRFKKGAEAAARRAAGSWVKAAYFDDRSPRYQEALRRATALGAPEGKYAREIQVARILFNLGLFFDCHEYLEPSWKDAMGREKRALQGLIQAGAGMHKLEQGSSIGCAHLLKEASKKLAEAAGPGLRAFGDALARAGELAEKDDLTPEQAPQLAADGLEL